MNHDKPYRHDMLPGRTRRPVPDIDAAWAHITQVLIDLSMAKECDVAWIDLAEADCQKALVALKGYAALRQAPLAFPAHRTLPWRKRLRLWALDWLESAWAFAHTNAGEGVCGFCFGALTIAALWLLLA